MVVGGGGEVVVVVVVVVDVDVVDVVVVVVTAERSAITSDCGAACSSTWAVGSGSAASPVKPARARVADVDTATAASVVRTEMCGMKPQG